MSHPNPQAEYGGNEIGQPDSMSRIKRFREHLSADDLPEFRLRLATERMLNDLADRLERLEQRLENHTHSVAIPAEGHSLDHIRETDSPTDTPPSVKPRPVDWDKADALAREVGRLDKLAKEYLLERSKTDSPLGQGGHHDPARTRRPDSEADQLPEAPEEVAPPAH